MAARTRSPALRGTVLAFASAFAFGLTTPAVQILARRAGPSPFATAMLLYLGAAVVGAVTRSSREAPVSRRHLARLGVVAISGALIAPSLLVWGLARTSGVAGSLMLNLEALFTIVLARLLYREHVGRRVTFAALLLLLGGALLVVYPARANAGTELGSPVGAAVSIVGLAAVGGAAFFWALDNALAKPLAALDPAAVVAVKGALGAALSCVATVVAPGLGSWPPPGISLVLVGVGAVGYGASLRLYLLAQRAIGAGRTASVFASGPFWGALLAGVLGEPVGAVTAAAAVVMVLGVGLHLTERHGHRHVHAPFEHDHSHRHDDGHHDHVHDPMPDGEHTHVHRHEHVVHDHPHVPDLHHDHTHEEHEPHDG
jgi:drug/metabolite transporter (DMT)-like permease